MTNKAEISKYLKQLGRKGGKTTAQNRTAKQRSDAARKAVKARWAKAKARANSA